MSNTGVAQIDPPMPMADRSPPRFHTRGSPSASVDLAGRYGLPDHRDRRAAAVQASS